MGGGAAGVPPSEWVPSMWLLHRRCGRSIVAAVDLEGDSMRLGWAVMLVWAVAGCGSQVGNVAGVDRRWLEMDLRFLADDVLAGRGMGSDGLEAAAAYQEAAFRAWGLEPWGGGELQTDVRFGGLSA